jgi:uncharacterized small protein (DUF1192 family)
MTRIILAVGLVGLTFLGIKAIQLRSGLNELNASIAELNADIETLKAEADKL